MNIFRKAVDTILPPKCSVCSKLAASSEEIGISLPEGMNLCFDCLSDIVPNPVDKRWMLCLSEPYSEDPYPSLALYMPFNYEGFFSRAVPVMKFQSRREIASFMGNILGELMKSDGITGDLIVPVALSRARLLERGFNQAGAIAESVSFVMGIPAAEDVLIRTRETLRQTEIVDKMNRGANVDRAFAVNDEWDIKGNKIILIDDVATTGNTLHSAAQALYEAGAASVLCCAVCGNRYSSNAEVF